MTPYNANDQIYANKQTKFTNKSITNILATIIKELFSYALFKIFKQYEIQKMLLLTYSYLGYT